MAHRESISNPELKSWMGASFFWNISNSVGYTCPNKPADVMLVQFLLNADIHEDNRRYSPQSPYLVLDGKFGGKTWNAIKRFQSKAWMGIPDGMVSAKADGITFFTPKQHGIYTIYLLNLFYKDFFRLYYMDISRDPMFPAALRPHLYGPLRQLV